MVAVISMNWQAIFSPHFWLRYPRIFSKSFTAKGDQMICLGMRIFFPELFYNNASLYPFSGINFIYGIINSLLLVF